MIKPKTGLGNSNVTVCREKGAVLILTFIVLLSLTAIALAFVSLIGYEIKATGVGLRNMQVFYIAEAGLAKARWALTKGGETAGWGQTHEPFGEGKGTYIVSTAYSDPPANEHVTIISEGYVPDDTNPIARRKVQERNIRTLPTNLSLDAAASASSVINDSTADKANDGESDTKWKSAVNNGSWLKIDFGSSATFDKALIDGSKIDSYMIEYSTDDVTYHAVTGIVESPAWTFTFDPVSAQYLRISLNGDKPEVKELESYNTAAGNTSLEQGAFVTSW